MPIDFWSEEAHNEDMSFHCAECFDTYLIDRAGAEIPCPYCSVAKYLPSSVTVKRREDGRWQAWDTSWDAAGVWYGIAGSETEARKYQRKRQGVIKAAITRRNNKKVAK